MLSVLQNDVLKHLKMAWETVPEWRMGQLLYFLATVDEGNGDVFYLTDEALIHGCQYLNGETELRERKDK